MIDALTSPRGFVTSVLAVSVSSLAFAFIAQHWFAASPCILCLYQRIPFALAALVAAVALVLTGRDPRRLSAVLGLCAVIFMAGAGLAAYHVGVEQHWWSSIAGCAVTPISEMSVDELRAAMTGPPPLAACDEVTLRVFGLSLAALNALFSAALAGFCALGAYTMMRHGEQ